jgi:NAD(P)-dependent dehydrogenase (short-subunit alcohol dehydrogenase family)
MALGQVTRRGAVIVTGASSGIGAACALRLDQIGFRVFATVLPGERAPLLQQASERLAVVELNVTEDASIASAAHTVAIAVGAAGLAGLINNAGVSATAAPLEFLPIATLRKQFEINVIGQIAVTQAFLPLLRQGPGRIVMMGSAYSSLICPFGGGYCASKSALAALTAALRVELHPWGIPVSIIRPGVIATPLWEKSIHSLDDIARALPPQAQNLYGRALAATRAFLARAGSTGSSPQAVAAAVEQALTARQPKTEYLVGRDARFNQLVMRLATSDRTRDRLVAWAMRLPRRE